MPVLNPKVTRSVIRTSLVVSVLFVLVSGTLPRVVGKNAGDALASWDMDEGTGNAVADSASGFNGEIHGATWAAGGLAVNSSGAGWDIGGGNSGSWALDFSGRASYVEVPHREALNAVNFTVAFWLAPDTSSDWGNIMGKQSWEKGRSAGWTVCWDAEYPRNIHLIVYNQSHSESCSAGVPIALGEWSHLVFTYADDEMSAYKNGRLVGKSESREYLPSDEPLMIGRACGDHHYFDGLLDEVKFYDRPLTESEVISLHDSYASPDKRWTEIVLEDISAFEGLETPITAKLVDEKGRAVAGAKVSFHMNDRSLGSAVTDSRGLATIRYKPLYEGAFNLMAEVWSTGTLDGCALTVDFVVTAPQDPSQGSLLAAIFGTGYLLGLAIIVKMRSSFEGWGRGSLWRSEIDRLLARFHASTWRRGGRWNDGIDWLLARFQLDQLHEASRWNTRSGRWDDGIDWLLARFQLDQLHESMVKRRKEVSTSEN